MLVMLLALSLSPSLSLLCNVSKSQGRLAGTWPFPQRMRLQHSTLGKCVVDGGKARMAEGRLCASNAGTRQVA
jgi:hypothetical protein